jgi:hypothetical protein
MKLAGVIVIYHPDDNLFRNIMPYIDFVEFLIIWENSSLPDKDNLIRQVSIGKFRFGLTDYSPTRRFYNTRNKFILYREYPYEYTIKDRGTWHGLFGINKPYQKTDV